MSDQADYGRYEENENAITVEAVQEKLAEIKDHPEKALLGQEQLSEDTCRIDVAVERQELSILFAFPQLGRALHTQSGRQPICDYISAQYESEQLPTPENFEHGLGVAKSPKK